MQTTQNFGLTIYEANDVTSYLTSDGWNGNMQKIDSALESIQTKAQTNTTDLTTLENQVATHTEQINTLNTTITTLSNTVDGNTSNISGLNNRMIGVENSVVELNEKVGNNASYTGVLSSGETTLAIEIGEFSASSLVDIYSSIYGVNPLTVELRAASSGQPNLCVTTWDEQTTDVNVAVKITNQGEV